MPPANPFGQIPSAFGAGYPGYPHQAMNYPYQIPPYQHPYQPVYQQVPTPQTITLEPQPPQQARCRKQIGFAVRYVLCLELFTTYQDTLILTNLNPEKDTVNSMMKMICARHSIDECLTLELFTKEGLALNSNIYTENCESLNYFTFKTNCFDYAYTQ